MNMYVAKKVHTDMFVCTCVCVCVYEQATYLLFIVSKGYITYKCIHASIATYKHLKHNKSAFNTKATVSSKLKATSFYK